MKFYILCDGKRLGGSEDIELAERIAKGFAVSRSPKMVSVRDSGQKRGDPARRTYKVEDGVLKWSELSETKIYIGEVKP